MRLVIGSARFELQGSGADGWAVNAQQDRAIGAAIRAGSALSISATDARGNRFTDRYSLDGAASAMDAASIGCAQNR